MVAGMLLALVPSAAILLGIGAAIFHFLRQPTIVWTFLLAVAFVAASVVLYGSLRVPYCFVKAFYGLAAAVPLCALAALGFDLVSASAHWLRAAVFVVLGVWACNSAASYVISPDAVETQRMTAKQLFVQQHADQALVKLERILAAQPDDDLTRILLANMYVYTKRDVPARRVLDLPAGQCERSARHYLLGILLARQKRTPEARREFQAALKTGLRRFGSGIGLRPSGIPGPELRASIDAWRNVLHVNPTYAPAHVVLARLYRKTGDPASARRQEQYFQALKEWSRQRKASGS